MQSLDPQPHIEKEQLWKGEKKEQTLNLNMEISWKLYLKLLFMKQPHSLLRITQWTRGRSGGRLGILAAHVASVLWQRRKGTAVDVKHFVSGFKRECKFQKRWLFVGYQFWQHLFSFLEWILKYTVYKPLGKELLHIFSINYHEWASQNSSFSLLKNIPYSA